MSDYAFVKSPSFLSKLPGKVGALIADESNGAIYHFEGGKVIKFEIVITPSFLPPYLKVLEKVSKLKSTSITKLYSYDVLEYAQPFKIKFPDEPEIESFGPKKTIVYSVMEKLQPMSVKEEYLVNVFTSIMGGNLTTKSLDRFMTQWNARPNKQERLSAKWEVKQPFLALDKSVEDIFRRYVDLCTSVLAISLNYYDFFSNNFMVGKDKSLKLIDLVGFTKGLVL